MYETVDRPLTESEKLSLRQRVPVQISAFKGLEVRLIANAIAAIIFGILLVIVMHDLRWHPSTKAIILFAAYLLYLWIQTRSLLIRPLRRRRRQMVHYLRRQQALANAERAQVLHIRSNDVVQIDHHEGSFYLFAIGSELSFWTSAEAPAKSWPNTNFEVFRIAGIVDELGPICHGNHLPPRRIIHFSDYFQDFDFDKLPEDGVIHASIDTFLKMRQGRQTQAKNP